MPDQASALLYGIDSRVMCLSWLSHVLAILGYPQQAALRNGEVSPSVRKRGHANTAAVALTYSAMFHQLIGDRDCAQAQAEALIALATEQGFPLYVATAPSSMGGRWRASGEPNKASLRFVEVWPTAVPEQGIGCRIYLGCSPTRWGGLAKLRPPSRSRSMPSIKRAEPERSGLRPNCIGSAVSC